MKKNKMGFMLAETLVVASFISVTLLFLFVQFRTLLQGYNTSFQYNTVNALYLTNQIKNYLQENNLSALTIDLENSSKGYVEISKCDSKFFVNQSYCEELMRQANVNKVVYVSSKNPTVGSDFSKTFVEFINRNINTEEDMYYLLAEYQDGTYGALKMNGIDFPNIVDKLKEQPIYTEGNTVDGLYVDNHSKLGTRYLFRGGNPNNYIRFQDDLYRIIAIEEQGIKVIGQKAATSKWNVENNFFTKEIALNKGSYPSSSITNSLAFSILNYDTDLDPITGIDGGFYEKIDSTYKNFILKTPMWYNGTVTSTAGATLDTIVQEEVARSYPGTFENAYIGLLNVSDFAKASLNAACTNQPLYNMTCVNNNYLVYLINNQWLLNDSTTENQVWYLGMGSGIVAGDISNEYDLVPVFYLKPTLRLTGSGTEEDPYIIINEK